MQVKVRLFASAREQAKTDQIELTTFPGATLQDLQAALNETYPRFNGMPGRWAVNLTFTSPHHRVQPHDEIAWIPPVSGG